MDQWDQNEKEKQLDEMEQAGQTDHWKQAETTKRIEKMNQWTELEETEETDQWKQADQTEPPEPPELPDQNKPKGKKWTSHILWIVLLTLSALIFFALLELNRHTMMGRTLTAFMLAGYVLLRTGWQDKLDMKQSRLSRLTVAHSRLWVRILCFLGVWVGFALIALISWPPVRAVPAAEGKALRRTNVIHVAQGDLSGVYTQDGEVEVFAGIPYAQPPVGDLRWKEPQPPLSWEGEFYADHFGPMSMQTQSLPIVESLSRIIGYHDYEITDADNYRAPVSEDSLYLNIWKPAGDVSGLPVLVYIHGGSLQSGQPWYADYSGEGLARQGVIVVNMGYRLGIFGFFADAGLAEESEYGTTGNYGLLDQIAALYWVRNNIAAFGGDPDNVTLAGESAGSACVSALCTSPLARGLFRRVVGESSTVTAPHPAHSFRTMEQALRAGQETKDRLGAQTIEALRALPAEKLVEEAAYHHHITVDGFASTETPYEAYARGYHNEEAQLQGFNLNESGPFLLFDKTDLETYEAKVRILFGDLAGQVLSLYPAATDAEAQKNWAEIYTVYYFSYGHHIWARQAADNGIPVYMYHFKQKNGRLGDWHSGEEVYFYGNIPENSSLYTDYDRRLSLAMQQYLVNFMKTGSPNAFGLPTWNTVDNGRTVMVFENDIYAEYEPYIGMNIIMDRLNQID